MLLFTWEQNLTTTSADDTLASDGGPAISVWKIGKNKRKKIR